MQRLSHVPAAERKYKSLQCPVCLFRTSVARERCAQSTKAVGIGTDELASNVQLVDVSALHFSEVLAVVQASHAV